MSFIKVNLNDVKEPTIAPRGRYEVQITACKEQLSRTTEKPMFRITIGFTGDNNFLSMTHYLPLPTEDDDKAEYKLLALRRFLTLFNIPYRPEGIDTSQLELEMVGAVAEVEVTQESVTGQNGEIMVNRLAIPRLPAEHHKR